MTPTLPLEVGLGTPPEPVAPPKPPGEPATVTAVPLSSVIELVAKISQAARAILAKLKNAEMPSPALVREIDALKKSAGELLRGGHLEALQESATNRIAEALRELPMRLKQFCEVHGLSLWGAFPDYIIQGTVYFGVDEKDYQANINGMRCPLFPFDQPFERVLQEVSRYSGGEFQPARFLECLWRTYQVCAKKQEALGKLIGRRVSVFEILPEMALSGQTRHFQKNPVKEQFRSYSQHVFRADLFRLLSAAEAPVIEGHRLVLEPTSVAEDGLFMFVPAVGRCAFVGHIVFLLAE